MYTKYTQDVGDKHAHTELHEEFYIVKDVTTLS
jgi:hypothetical protein